MSLVHELFERRAREAPEAIAVRFQNARLSYGELNGKANQLARYLEARGIGREGRVVVCVEPGFEIVVALLAILKLGAVYVPLDPSYPVARIQIILNDIQPALILTRSELSEKLPFANRATLELDTAGPQLSALSSANLNVRLETAQTAYVYYTSGTTGVPKGVMASQANLASYIGLAQSRYGFTSSDLGPAIARFSFSISMFELLSPLVAGGTLLILERPHVLDLERLSQTLREVTFFHAGPSLLRSLLSYIKRHYDDFTAFSRVRHASSGGDMVPVEVLEGLREVFFEAEVFVIYGCSEISCMGCTYPVPRDTPLVKTYVGKPFDGMTVRVVDDELRPAPSGVVGEVLFAGPGVVKGYLNRPDLSCEKFIELEDQRCYRTGDRGRIGDEGWLELLGRSDFQVKVAGMRVELGEIEHHLRRAPGVTNGVVVARDIGKGEKSLVAYVVLETDDGQGTVARASTLRRHLAEQLPDYMVPSTYVELPALPLNFNMKIDRNALPDPPRAGARAVSGRALREAETPTELCLASLWKRILGIDQVGLQDNFFDLGGTSMLALQLILEIDRELGVTLAGLEVLRESLQMQALLCERRAGKQPCLRSESAVVANAEALELFHFGPGQSLFGVLHGAPGTGGGDAAVLICAPIGHEYVRAHFILQRLARQISAEGVSVMRFDYFGCRDSLGEGIDATCTRWQRDIADAHQELKRRTRAAHVTAIGVRLGATLLAAASSSLDLTKLVLWDPIQRGSAHLAELRLAHRQYLRATSPLHLQSPIAKWRARGKHELLGSSYSGAALRELRELAIPSSGPRSCPVETLTSDSAWLDLAHLEDMLPDPGVSRALTKLVLEQP